MPFATRASSRFTATEAGEIASASRYRSRRSAAPPAGTASSPAATVFGDSMTARSRPSSFSVSGVGGRGRCVGHRLVGEAPRRCEVAGLERRRRLLGHWLDIVA